MIKKDKNQKGIGMVEVIVGLAVIAVTFWAFFELARYNLKIQEQSRLKIEALSLATEAIEATRSVRDEDWTNIDSLVFGTRYYPIISGGGVNKWTLNSTDPGPVNGVYDRWIIAERVFRDGNDDIAAAGTEDTETRKITVVVEWSDHGTIRDITLTSYLTSWTAN